MCNLHLSKWLSITCLLIALLLVVTLPAQDKLLVGAVKDSVGVPLRSASVALLNNNNLVIRYGFTDERGDFALMYSPDAIWLDINYVGYQRQKIKVDTGLKLYRIVLKQDINMLEEVVVKKRPPTILLGDTLKYFVEEFATKEDRSIGDVLRRLPGIEISQDGTIFF